MCVLNKHQHYLVLSLRLNWRWFQSDKVGFIVQRPKGDICLGCFNVSMGFHSIDNRSIRYSDGQYPLICGTTFIENCHPGAWTMMMSSNGNIFRVTGHLCGEFTGTQWIPRYRPVTRSFDVFFDLRFNKRLSKQSGGWWFKTPSCPLWRHCNVIISQHWFR